MDRLIFFNAYLVLMATPHGGVVGGVVNRVRDVGSWCQVFGGLLGITGGDNVNPGDGGGMELHELMLEPAESSL